MRTIIQILLSSLLLISLLMITAKLAQPSFALSAKEQHLLQHYIHESQHHDGLLDWYSDQHTQKLSIDLTK
ncbi:hypothetical protein [Latilactobacillus fragifolii]|uniref:hypothetical protein n=1 Tax=Latilactobacillus fragifolii TaxID=2814244 RepID=UPI001ABA2AFC|nr:hypothetical protein [Latilactobacillus fragifolii]